MQAGGPDNVIVIPLNDKRKSLTLPEEGREMNLGRRRSSILLQVDLARATSSRFSTSENKDASKGKTTNYSMYSSIIFLVVCVVLILIGTHVIPGATMPGIEAYNAVHIFSNVLCHFVAVDVGFVCFNLHRIIIAVKVSKNGITLNELNSHELTTKIPGARLRQLMVICSLALVVVMSFMTVNFAWKPVPTIVATDFCISPVYDVKPKFIDDVGPFMIGTSEFTLIQHHGLPLADGIAGGWAGQPLVHPASEFIIEGDGLGYVMSTECFEEYSAADGINGTALTMTESFLHGDNTAIDGRVIIQIPAGSIISPFDTGNGVKFECTFAIRFGQAKIKFAFSSDSWGHMLEKSIQSFAVGDLSVTNENSKDVSSRELSDILQATLERVFDGTPNSNGPQALIINYVWAGSTPDGYYSQPIMWKGLAFALATVTHNLLWQYNTTSRSECDYFAEVGSGMLITNESWVAGAQWLCYAVLFCILAHIMWISVLYPFSDEADIVLCSMGNPLRFAHDMGASGRTIFSERGLETHDDDFLAKRGDTVVRYGVKMSSIDQGLYKIGYGLKKSVVPIKKLIRKEVREARANGASTGVMSQRKMH